MRIMGMTQKYILLDVKSFSVNTKGFRYVVGYALIFDFVEIVYFRRCRIFVLRQPRETWNRH